ncbi:MAG: TRAP transporter small permease subunit [Dehalococcoidia bacterium]|nr:MAG: TRAP transporter small permease subunit [Dehalococcoidia bacterium]
MTKYLRIYVRFVDAVSIKLGRSVRYLLFASIGIYIFEIIARNAFNRPGAWVLELSTFLVAAYFVLGGAYSVLTESQVRMDIFYEHWSRRRRALVDAITFPLYIYFGVLFIRGIWHTRRAFIFKEITMSSWGPLLWPIKGILTAGFLLILLQGISILIKDIYAARGRSLE